jgi:hypothetical protein
MDLQRGDIRWHDEQEWEMEWWGNCVNTFGEEAKQITYAHRMGLTNTVDREKWPIYDLTGRSVLDIGGGPVSILLKTVNAARRVVADPGDYPRWTVDRYTAAGIECIRTAGEDIATVAKFDEVWIYNVLQHVQDPARIIANAKIVASTIRLFEWIDRPPHPGHPHELKADVLEQWLGAPGTVEDMDGENRCVGRAFYGVFPSLD